VREINRVNSATANARSLAGVKWRGYDSPNGIIERGGKIYFTCEVNRLIARYDPAADKVDWVMGAGRGAARMLVATADAR